MARKDEIFTSFLKHDIIKNDYDLDYEDLPKTVREGLNSEYPIIKTLALIVENTEGVNPNTDKATYLQITQFLNMTTDDY
ncbi:hypothetical protein BBH99_00325 [Chryseobacterium contaminans]|uniref:Uncharacterized protein n=1 Tax=Chryseobacterium contaminans TaxID=1423959 RepID=A0A1M6VPQ9_9FLAO|nr:hypothetical protein [Chryseobacterium contaminans]OCA80583.1 hypothetical protein BBH99_00325 [Chryseobacterium contaminans]SHK83226.1 hypothetical protein SAMN05444407_101299 [Chryseobacterium contaminans]